MAKEPEQRACAYCGKMFVPTHRGKRGRDARFCSLECYRDQKRRERHEVSCRLCGKVYLPNLDQLRRMGGYCSLKCYQARGEGERPEITCGRCGARFTATTRQQVRRGVGYCRDCAGLLKDGPEVRFWKWVDRTGDCWIWRGKPNPNGYCSFTPKKGEPRIGAHRYAWMLTNGPIPDGLEVCHRCDVKYPPRDIGYRRCVRPDHLFLGTPAENSADMTEKGRAATGARNGNVKLAASDIPTIRRRRENGELYPAIARDYGVSKDVIRQICLRVTWRELP